LEAAGDAFFHSLSIGADYKDITESVDGTDTPIAYTNLSGNYTFGWNWPKYRSSYYATVNAGANGLGNEQQEFGDKRFKAQSNYFYVNLGMEQLVNTLGGVGLFLRVNGQATSQPLINNEQFAVGGAMSVRGYLEAEELGDFGAFANVEVRSPNIGPWLWNGLESLSLHAFYDYASLGLNDVLPGQNASVDLDSYGFGFRLVATSGLVLSLDWADPLEDATTTAAGDTRTHFIFRWNF
ncbi:MAG: ShlB/FhaC/HecB family hemolysin secretion/activation protein, partial [Pseudomonadota bacterium]